MIEVEVKVPIFDKRQLEMPSVKDLIVSRIDDSIDNAQYLVIKTPQQEIIVKSDDLRSAIDIFA